MMLLVIYLVILVAAWYYLYATFHSFDLISLLLVSYILFYGFYTLSDLYIANVPIDLFSYIMTTLLIWSEIIIFIAMKHYFLRSKANNLINFNAFSQVFKKVNTFYLAFGLLIIVMIIAYFYLTYGLIFRVSKNYFENLPLLSTYTSIIEGIVIPIAFLILLTLIEKSNVEQGVLKKAYLIVIIVILVYFLLYSRRIFLFGLVMSLLFYFYLNNKNPFSIKSLLYIGMFALIAVMGSNFYQGIRKDILTGNSIEATIHNKNVGDMLLNFEATNENLVERTSLMTANNRIMEQLLFHNKGTLEGSILYHSFLNAIPKVLYPGKKVINDDELVSRQFGFRATDLGTSMQGSLLADFGFFSIIIYPLLMFFYTFFIVYIMNMFKNIILVRFLVIGLAIKFFYNLETSLSGYFLGFRDLVLIIIFSLFFHLFQKIFTLIIKGKQ